MVAVMTLVSACGFQPFHERQQADAGAASALNQILISPLPERLGQLLRMELANRLTPKGPPPTPVYLLNVKLSESKQSLGVRKDATATRANLIITANFDLLDKQAGEKLLSGKVRSINSYNILDAEFATLSAESDARRRAARDLAAEIQSRLGMFLSRPTTN